MLSWCKRRLGQTHFPPESPVFTDGVTAFVQNSSAGRTRYLWHSQPVWQALNVVLGLMEAPVLAYLLSSFPQISQITFAFARRAEPFCWPGLACIASLYQNADARVSSHQ